MAAASAAAVRNVFVYGSLLAPEVLKAIISRVPPSAPAVVPNFHCYRVTGQLYPAVRPRDGDEVTGKVLFGLTQQELTLLDDFEDIDYKRQVVKPTLLDKRPDQTDISLPVQAYMYIWAKEDESLQGDWDYENVDQFLAVLPGS